jgi:hypothetical protein
VSPSTAGFQALELQGNSEVKFLQGGGFARIQVGEEKLSQKPATEGGQTRIRMLNTTRMVQVMRIEVKLSLVINALKAPAGRSKGLWQLNKDSFVNLQC